MRRDAVCEALGWHYDVIMSWYVVPSEESFIGRWEVLGLGGLGDLAVEEALEVLALTGAHPLTKHYTTAYRSEVIVPYLSKRLELGI